MVEKPGKLLPALVGGLVVGLGSIGGSFVPLVNLCCCLWPVIGGVVAAFMLIKRSPTLRVTNGDGATTGLLAGVVGSLIFLVIGLPFIIMSWGAVTAEMLARSETMNDPASQESIKRMVEFMQNNTVISAILIWFISALLFMGFATIGGILGVAIFEKRKDQPPPPPWPPAGGPSPPPEQAPY